MGASQSSSLPHSLHESFFQSVHTHSPFFYGPPPHTPIHPQAATTGSSELQVQTLPIPLLYKLFSSPVLTKAQAPWITTDLLTAHLLPLPNIYPSLTSDRKAGRSIVSAMLFSPFDQTQVPFHLVNCYIPFKAPIESNSSRKPSLTLPSQAPFGLPTPF